MTSETLTTGSAYLSASWTPEELRAAGYIGPYMFCEGGRTLTFTEDEYAIMQRALFRYATDHGDRTGEIAKLVRRLWERPQRQAEF